MKRIAEALGVARSNLAKRAHGKGQPRGPYSKATDDAVLPLTRDFAAALNLVPCFTPVRSPESNGMAEAFVKP
jgi:transposase InsO family protein